MRRLTFLFACLFIAGISLVSAQATAVSGKVVSADNGEPIIGASVLVKGTSQGTISDVDGNFTLNVPSDANTLVISYIGMETVEIEAVDGVVVELQLSTEALDEVMVVAYGTAKKSAFTGSAAVVNAEDIGKVQSSNAANALVGKVAGVQLNTASGQPGTTTPTIRVRGISSINAGNDPLIILDGAPYDGDLNTINSQDIETMTVLKDAASNALYGARGANGVIIITTKKGDSGKTTVNVDAKWGVNTRATQDYNFITSPAQYYEMYYGALKSYYMSTGLSEAAAHVSANTNMTGSGSYGLGYNVYSVPSGQYLIGTNGRLNPNATLGNVVTYNGQEYTLLPDNWLDEAYSTGLRQEYNVSFSAGTNKSSYYASVNYLNNEGITANSDYERLTARLRGDYEIKEWLKTGANMSYTHYNVNSLDEDGSSGSSGNIFAYATQIAPIYPLYIRDGEGNIMTDANGLTMYDFGSGDNAGLSRPFLSGNNPYATNILNTNNAEGNAMTATGFAEIRFLKDFKFTWTSGMAMEEARATGFTNPYYGQYASSNGISSKVHARNLSYNHQQLLTYKRAFGSHNLDVMIGHESYRSTYYYLYASKSNVLNPDNTELAGAITEVGSNSYTTDYNTEGYFGRVQYDFAEKYFVSGSYRRDASSRFHPDHRWGDFWSAGAAWLLSKEGFFNVDWIDLMKVKASYGQQGNDNIGNYRYVNTYDIVNAGGVPAAVPYTMGNEEITWETNGNLNAGVEFDFFKTRLSGSIEYFYRKTTDMLFSFPLPPSFGYTSYYANIGDMQNQGVEADLSGTVLKYKNFTWEMNLNLTHYKNKVIYLPEERKTMTVDGVQGFSSGNYYYGEGIPLYTFRMKKYAGVSEDGEALYYMNVLDSDGNVIGQETTTEYESADYYLCGTALPDLYGGFGTKFSFYGFDLSIDFAYQIGGLVYDSDYASLMSVPTSSSKGTNFHADLLNAWTPENTDTDIPRFQFGDTYTTSTSDRFLTSASYLSLQNINFGYTLPAKVTRRAGIEKLRIYLAADNVWLWSTRQGLDPRQSISGSTTNAYYAPIRTISGGISLTF